FYQLITSFCAQHQIDITVPFEELLEKQQEMILYGSDQPFSFHYQNDKGMVRRTQAFYEGVIPRIKRMYHETSSELVRKQISSYLVQKECATCKGTRLKEEMLHVR